ncbi:MAG: hypothetical protein IPO37_02290 [Saprospiraceae bacterium]|nr:hypothetical protein [Saprospiraceae bacterium]
MNLFSGFCSDVFIDVAGDGYQAKADDSQIISKANDRSQVSIPSNGDKRYAMAPMMIFFAQDGVFSD